jgi:hypothetical protein
VGHGAQVCIFFSLMATWTVMISNLLLIKKNHGDVGATHFPAEHLFSEKRQSDVEFSLLTPSH